MKHLFIINPKAGQVRGRVDEIENGIRKFFAGNPQIQYFIHTTRWKRDASGYILRHVSNAEEMIRVYAIGGNGTLFEVINGVVGLPNVQVAWYPAGRDNSMLCAFGGGNSLSSFQSFRNLCLSPVITIDAIKAGNHYTCINTLIGNEAKIFHRGEILADKTRLSRNIYYSFFNFANAVLKNNVQQYTIETEKTKLSGDFSSILVTNIPKGTRLIPAREAGFNNGCIDLFVLKCMPKNKVLSVVHDYAHGLFHRWPGYISHYQCKRLKISSGSVMNISIDGEFFCENSLEFEICPRSVDFVCPSGINPVQGRAFKEEKPAACGEDFFPQEIPG